MKPALQLVIQKNDFMQPVVDYVHDCNNVRLIHFDQDDEHIRIIYDATEEQQERFDAILKDMLDQLNIESIL